MDIKAQRKLAENIIGSLQENNIEKYQVNFHISKPKVRIPANIMVFQAFAFLAATKLKPATNCVLMFLFSQSVYENFISADILTIAETLEYTEQSVITALNELVTNNIVVKVKHPNDKRRNDYFLNPTAAWKGNSYTRKKVIEKMDKTQLTLFNRVQVENNANFNTRLNTNGKAGI